MSEVWPRVSLGNLIRLERRPVTVIADRIYQEIGIYCFGRGVFHKPPRSGLEVGDKALYAIRDGDLILQVTFAWEGAIALCSKAEEGLYGSTRYPTFRVNEERCVAPFLVRYLGTSEGLEQLNKICPGSAGRNRVLSIKRIAEVKVPLPPLPEQRRIVARIGELATKTAEAKGLRQETVEEAEALVLSSLHHCFVSKGGGWATLPLDQVVAITDKQVDPTLPDYCTLPHISGENIESKTCRLLHWQTAEADGVRSSNYLFSPNTVLYSKIRPYLRKAAFVDFQGVCSADVYPIRVIRDGVDTQFLKWSLVAEPFTNYANGLSGRTRMPKLNRKQLFAFPFSYPPLPQQRRIVAYLDGLQAQVDTLKHLQAEAAAELNAMLPAILDRAFRGAL